jgi:hypothetical protein
MKSKKIISTIAIALTFSIASSTIGSNAYASEISTKTVATQENSSSSLSVSDAKKIAAIINQNITFSNGHYSFNKNNAIKQGVKSDYIAATVNIVNDFNKDIDNGTLKVSSDGKINSINMNNNLDSGNLIHTDTTSPGGDGGSKYKVVYAKFINSSTCSKIASILNEGADVGTLGVALVAWLSGYGAVAAKYSGVPLAIMKLGADAFQDAANDGGTTLYVKALANSEDVLEAFLR